MNQQISLPKDIACIDDYKRHAKDTLSKQAWAYINGASADAITQQNNRKAFNSLPLKSRVLATPPNIDMTISLFGKTYSHPILLAPVAHQKLAHPSGEIATCQAAAAQEAIMVVSTLANTDIQCVMQHSNGDLWFQLYIQHDKDFTLQLVQRAESLGYKALVVTVDSPINGLRNAEQRVDFTLPEECTVPNLTGLPTRSDHTNFEQLLQDAPTWQTISWLKQNTQLPIIIKGIMCSEDAQLALDAGVDAIIVSNHGGRSLDTIPASIDVLGEISQVVNKQIPILLDGGIRRGTDILKAIALGADAVLIGRPIMYALSTAGALGVAHMLRILQDELKLTLALCGYENLKQVDQRCLHTPYF